MGKGQQPLQIPYGISHFETIRKDGFLYVDKTHFIRQLEKTRLLIYLRPRRFGKSLFVSMLEAYYDVAHADKFDEQFNGLLIHENPTAYRNRYYVLRFNFSGIATKDVDMILSGFLRRVKNSIRSFVKKYHLKIEIEDDTTPAGMLDSLLSTFGDLYSEHKVYILIDEYDHFTNAVLNNGLDDFMALVRRGGVVRSFYEVIKLNCERGTVERFFMTGVMSVSLDSMTSGFNVGTNVTTDEKFADMMGFTSSEAKSILNTCLQNTKEEAVNFTELEQEEVYDIWKQNYNGYLFSARSDTKVFNSTLIMYYLQKYIEKKKHPESLVDPNLNQSGTTIKSLAELKNREANYEVVAEIVKERGVSGRLSPFIDVDEAYERNDFITLLFNMGLLTIKEAGIRTRFKMPNKIIEMLYLQYLSELEQKRLDYKMDVQAQEIAIDEMAEGGKIDQLTQLVSNFLAHTSGRTDIGLSEKEIQLIYLFIMSLTDQYMVDDEFPALRGYCDVVVLKTPASYAKYEFVIELKHLKKGEATPKRIQKAFDAGVDQIATYMKDKRLAGRCDLKKFVVVFAGVEVVRLEEVESCCLPKSVGE